MKTHFTQEEANEILLRAVEQQPPGRSVTREELESLALEIGVTPESLRAAEEGWLADRLREAQGRAAAPQREMEERALFHRWQEEHNKDVMGFAAHLCVFLFVALFAVILALDFGEEALVLLMFLIPWSIWLVFKGVTVFGKSSIPNEKAFRKWQKARLEDTPERDPVSFGRRPVR